MRIAIFCATNRGLLFLQELKRLLPESEFLVFSFKEEPWEPPFLENIRELTRECHGDFKETTKITAQEWNDFVGSKPVDILFAVNWRHMIPENIYKTPSMGAFVFHDSLLPEYRGFSPTVWAMINGESRTGVTLFEFAKEFDAGDTVDQKEILIGSDDTIADVMGHVTEAYLDLLRKNLKGLINGTALRYPQDHSRATYTCKRLPEDNLIDWSASTQEIYNLIRAVTFPYPGAYTYLDDKLVRVWSARKIENPKAYTAYIPGRVVKVSPGEGSVVMTGNGLLLLVEVQREGEDSVCASDLINSTSLTLGRRQS